MIGETELVMTKDLDSLANLWNKTKNPKYKKLWYKLVRETHGYNNIKRWNLSTDTSYKTDDGWNSFNKQR